MYAEERQQAIAESVLRHGRVSVTELASSFEVTTETVRRDLSALEQTGLIRRVHGGAVPSRSVMETRLAERDEARTEEKARIARAAVGLLPPGQASLLLDAGSSVGRLAAHLPHDRNLMVFTHALTTATRLGQSSNVELLLLPGRVRSATQAAVGAETVAALSQLRVEIAFVGTNGLTTRHGLSTPDSEEAAAKAAMVAAADRVVVLADADKIGQEHPVRFASLDDVDTLVTDDRVSDADVTALEAAGLTVVVA